MVEQKVRGYVAWFNRKTGEGMVRGFDNKKYFLHWSSIRGESVIKEVTHYSYNSTTIPFLKQRQVVEFTVYSGEFGASVSVLWAVNSKKNEVRNFTYKNAGVILEDKISQIDGHLSSGKTNKWGMHNLLTREQREKLQ